MERSLKIPERKVDIEKIKNPKLKAMISSIFGINSASKGKSSAEGDKDHSYDEQYSDYDDEYNCYRDGGY